MTKPTDGRAVTGDAATRRAVSSAKRAQCAVKSGSSAGRHVQQAVAVATTNSSSGDDVASIFSALQSKKNGKPQSAPTVRATNGAKRTAHGESLRSRKPRDGLYRAAEKTVAMSDDDFFAGTTSSSAAGAGKGGKHRPHKTSSILNDVSTAAQHRLREEGVDRIVTEKELSRMVSRSKRAGTTPNCPFDCDCCF